jgi:hypothetical protein
MTTLDHIVFRVNNLQGSLQFYTTLLGFVDEGVARGLAPKLYFNDPNKHLLEIRFYEES